MRILIPVLLVLALPARAQEARDAAQQIVALADADFQAGDLETALGEYRQAYARYPSPRLHYNLALCLEGLDRPAEAVAEFEAFLAEASDAPIQHREYASAATKRLGPKIGRIALSGYPIGAKVVLDGQAAGVTPIARPIPVTPGAHTVVVGKTSRALTVRAGETFALTESRPGSTPITKRWWFWTGAAVIVATAVTVGVAVSTQSSSSPSCGLGCVPLP